MPGVDPDKACFDFYDHNLSARDAIHNVVRDVLYEKANCPPETIAEAITDKIGGSFYGQGPDKIRDVLMLAPDYDMVVHGTKDWNSQRKQTDEERRAAWARYDEQWAGWSEMAVAVIMEIWKDKDIYVLEYSDNDGNAAMEHGGVFDTAMQNGNCIAFSHH